MSIDVPSLILGAIVSMMVCTTVWLMLEKHRALKRLEQARAYREMLERSADDIAPYIKGATHDR